MMMHCVLRNSEYKITFVVHLYRKNKNFQNIRFRPEHKFVASIFLYIIFNGNLQPYIK